MGSHGRGHNWERKALLASGVRDDKRQADYMQKLDDLYKQLISFLRPSADPLAQAEALFRGLWEEKPDRYEPRGHFRLSDVIDAQLSKEKRPVGNCLGLTLLYNCLLRRMGLRADAVYLDHAFGVGPHVLTLLEIGKSTIDIENILPDGFNYKGHLHDPSRTRWRDNELVADIYHSLGNECFERGKLNQALRHYEGAIKLNPRYEKARLNKMILSEKMGKKRGSREVG
jgi:tetratricopeptide (TPR) repeat protein